MSDTNESDESTDAANTLPNYVRGLAAAIAVLVCSGLAHGYLDGRWAANVDLVNHAKQLADLPEQCGAWGLVNQRDLDESALQMLRCYGSTLREYVNRETGDRVNVAVMFGPRGPTAIHIPEICFDSIGTEQVDERKKEVIETGGKRHSLWSVQFSRDGDTEPSIDAWYAWSDGAEWSASNYPRFWMTDTLYKVQASGPVGDDGGPGTCRDFLTSFLPQLQQVMVRE